MSSLEYLIVPDWPAPENVCAWQTTRRNGCSQAPYDSLNLGDHVGDAPLHVAQNRMQLNALFPSEPLWLKQCHGVDVVDADLSPCHPEADASCSRKSGVVCAVMTADCLPVLLCNEQGSVVAALHAGWRGLCDGVIEQTVQAMNVPSKTIMAWLGPAIGPQAFEVGDEVRNAFVVQQPQAANAFLVGQPGKWHADIFSLARQRLHSLGIERIYGGDRCTYNNPQDFFSYRRDGVTGRMGSFIWLTQ